MHGAGLTGSQGLAPGLADASDAMACEELSGDDLEVLVAGDNFWGQLGLGEGEAGDGSRRRSFVPVPRFTSRRVVNVAAGDAHTAILTDDGALYTFGCGRSGQLGHGSRDSYLRPCAVEGLAGVRLVKVACGAQSTVCLSSVGRAFIMGTMDRYSYTPAVSRVVFETPAALDDSDGERFVDCALTAYHAALVTATGRLYTFGWNHQYQLGHGDRKNKIQPKCVRNLQRHHVVQAAVGRHHTVALLSDGYLVGWGSTKYGALGPVRQTAHTKPMLLELRVPVPAGSAVTPIAVAAGAFATFVTCVVRPPTGAPLTAIFAMGAGTDGQLGYGQAIAFESLARVPLPRTPLASDPRPRLAFDEGMVLALEAGSASGGADDGPIVGVFARPSAAAAARACQASGDAAAPGYLGPGADGAYVSASVPPPPVFPSGKTPGLDALEQMDASGGLPLGLSLARASSALWHSAFVYQSHLWTCGWAYSMALGYVPTARANTGERSADVLQMIPRPVTSVNTAYAVCAAACGAGHTVLLARRRPVAACSADSATTSEAKGRA